MNAEEMFKELGYEIFIDRDIIIYKNNLYDDTVKEITFYLMGDNPSIIVEEIVNDKYEDVLLTFPELKAINKQVEELGW